MRFPDSMINQPNQPKKTFVYKEILRYKSRNERDKNENSTNVVSCHISNPSIFSTKKN